jgi:hypothetical protein
MNASNGEITSTTRSELPVLLAELRHALSDRLIVVTEPWWGKEPNA